MVAVLDSAFVITGEWATVGLLRYNLIELLCLKFTTPTCHSVMLYHRLVLPLIMCVKDASFLCPSAGYVYSLLSCPQFMRVQKYFGLGGAYGHAYLRPLPAPRPRPRP